MTFILYGVVILSDYTKQNSRLEVYRGFFPFLDNCFDFYTGFTFPDFHFSERFP